MGKKRWKSPAPAESASMPRAPESKRLGRWRQKNTTPVGPSKSNLRIFGGLFALVVVIALIIAIILVLRPVPRPLLVLISAQYREPLLDPNAFATRDAESIHAHSSIFDVTNTDPVSLNGSELASRVARLAEATPRRGWFGGEPGSLVVYVNAAGAAVWSESERRAVGYLLANDFEAPTQLAAGEMEKAVKVSTLLEALAKSPAARKILILDCQRFDSLWPIGILANSFVESVEEDLARLTPEQRKGMYVVASCSSGERTWVDYSRGRSLFNLAFEDAVTGRADQSGDGDNTVTLKEVLDYVVERVSSEARYHADVQTPRLMVGDEGTPISEVRLTPVRGPLKTDPPPTRDAGLLAKIQAAWRDYYALSTSDPPPWQYAPHPWRLMEETLLRAESFHRAHDPRAVELELSNLPRQRREIEDALPELIDQEGYSLAMEDYFAKLSRKRDNASTQGLRGLFDDLLRQDSFEQFQTKLSQSEYMKQALPVEIKVALQFAGSTQAKSRVQDAKRLVQQRELAESSMTAGGRWAGDVYPWLRARLLEADAGRRVLEDQFLLDGATAKPVGSDPKPISIDLVQRLYQQARDQGQSLAGVLAARERALAELVHYQRYVGRRPWGIPVGEGSVDKAERSTEEDRREQSERAYDRLVRDLASLNDRLENPPDESTPRDKVDEAIVEIERAGASLEKQRQILREILASELRELSRNALPPETEIIWRRIDDLLLVPFANPSDGPDDASRARAHLLERSCQDVKQANIGSAGGTQGKKIGNMAVISPTERRALVLRWATLARQIFRVGLGNDADVDLDAVQSSAQIGSYVGSWWRKTRERAVEPPAAREKRKDLFQGDLARRIIEASVSRTNLKPHTQALRELMLADFLAEQARRMVEDFWAGQPGEARDYFDLAATRQLERARRFHPLGETAYQSLADRIDELRRLAGSLQVAAEPATVRFSVQDQQDVQLRMDMSPSLPAGIAGIDAAIDPPGMEIRREPEGKFVLLRGQQQQGQATFTAQFRFRGHKALAPVPVFFADDENGPTVIYESKLPADATYSLRLAEQERSDLKLLFVLDCSASMHEKAGESSRILELIKTLNEFADETPRGSVDVGVRWFGSQVEDGTAKGHADGAKDTLLKVPLSPFDPDRFKENIPARENAKGRWTPLFQAIVEAKRDFQSIVGDKQIVVISDGLDNCSPANLEQVRNTFKDSGIVIHTVGYFFKDATQLDAIAKATGGRYIPITDSATLLKELTGLVGTLNYGAYPLEIENPAPYPKRLAQLQTLATPFTIPRGLYKLQLVDRDGAPAAPPFLFRARPGDQHDFVYQGGRIGYMDDESLAGDLAKSADGHELRIFRKRPAGSGMEIAFALFKPTDATWQPDALDVTVECMDADRRYTFRDLSPNVPGLHVPAWRLTLQDWPSGSPRANLIVSWGPASNPIEIDLTKGENKLPSGIECGSPRFAAPSADVGPGVSAVFKFAFPSDMRARMQDWSVALPPPAHRVRRARQIYDLAGGVYTGYFEIENVDRVEKIMLYPPRERNTSNTLQKQFEFKGSIINVRPENN